MNRVTSLIIEAGPSFRVTSLTDGRVKIELEDVELPNSGASATTTAVYDKTGLARRLGVGRRSIDNYIRQKRNPLPYTIAMGRARFLESDVMKWLTEGSSAAARRVKHRLGF